MLLLFKPQSKARITESLLISNCATVSNFTMSANFMSGKILFGANPCMSVTLNALSISSIVCFCDAEIGEKKFGFLKIIFSEEFSFETFTMPSVSA